ATLNMTMDASDRGGRSTAASVTSICAGPRQPTRAGHSDSGPLSDGRSRPAGGRRHASRSRRRSTGPSQLRAVVVVDLDLVLVRPGQRDRQAVVAGAAELVEVDLAHAQPERLARAQEADPDRSGR